MQESPIAQTLDLNICNRYRYYKLYLQESGSPGLFALERMSMLDGLELTDSQEKDLWTLFRASYKKLCRMLASIIPHDYIDISPLMREWVLLEQRFRAILTPAQLRMFKRQIHNPACEHDEMPLMFMTDDMLFAYQQAVA